MWKSIIGVWMKVRPGLTKVDPTNTAEILRQPIFENPLVLNERGIPLGLGGLSEGNAFAKAGCTRTKDLWNPGEQGWKSLVELGMSYHASNKKLQGLHHRKHPLAADRKHQSPEKRRLDQRSRALRRRPPRMDLFHPRHNPGTSQSDRIQKNDAQRAHSGLHQPDHLHRHW